MQAIQQLSLNALKINRHLVHGVRGADAKAVAGAIIRVAEVLGIRTLGEGVDSEEQAQVLRELGCYAGDGHLWGQPVPVEEVAELLRRLPE
jgi:EAL domain-containing protein (putative c-di-GMP-specific phosphodiesterase class I)